MYRLPVVSVVIPLYNKEKYIGKTIDRVLKQTYESFEVIVVNDGSTDDSAKIISEVLDKRVRLVNQENSGVSVARNRGALEAVGDLLVFLDADDQWSERFLEFMVMAFSDNDTDWVICAESRVREGAELPDDFDLVETPMFENKNFFELFLNSKVGCPGTILMKRHIFSETGGFIKGIKNGEDVEMWLRIALHHPNVKYCSSRFVRYMLASSDGATVIQRSEDSLITFWQAMAKLVISYENNYYRELFLRCFNQFANKSYRFYVRDNYIRAADYLHNLDGYKPCLLNKLAYILPVLISKTMLNFVHQIRTLMNKRHVSQGVND